MNDQSITFYCNKCDDFPSGVDIEILVAVETTVIECNDCGAEYRIG